MDRDPKPPDPAQLLRDLETNQALRHQPVAGAQLEPSLALLRIWQSERLARTYADLLADKRYRPACLFFLNDIYAPRDFSQRDHDLERIQATVAPFGPIPIAQVLAHLVELNHLTNRLDQQLVQVLVDQLGVTDAITPELYAEAYRRCDNYADRAHQLDLIAQLVAQVGGWARLRVIGLALKIVRGPAYKAGWVELFDFLERGYGAFRQMKDVTYFVETIQQREQQILDRIYAGDADPFSL